MMVDVDVNPSDDQRADEFVVFVHTVGELHRSLVAAGEAIMAGIELSPARSRCLLQIADEPLTVASIAARMGSTRQGVQRVADALVDTGFAEYVANPRHRRAHLLTPTPVGRDSLLKLDAAHRQWVAGVAAQLAPDNLTDLTGRLRRVNDGVQNAPGSAG